METPVWEQGGFKWKTPPIAIPPAAGHFCLPLSQELAAKCLSENGNQRDC